jgi:DNA repair photolyase
VKPKDPDLVVIHRDTKDGGPMQRRVDRLLGGMTPGDVVEADDAGLDEIARTRWSPEKLARTAPRGAPDVLLMRWDVHQDSEAYAEREKQHPGLGGRLNPLLSLALRDDGNLEKKHGSWCTTGWELHSVIGCPYQCSYCDLGVGVMNVAVNIEEQVAMLDRWTKMNNFQTLYKWDNSTDINALEPEYDATRLFIDYFAQAPRKYLLLYTGKSDNVDFMLDYDHRGKTIVQWSLAPRTQSTRIEPVTAPWDARIEAARKCRQAGYIIRYRLSPIIPVKNWREEYAELIAEIFAKTQPDVISLCFFGWMTATVMQQVLPTPLLDPWALEGAIRAESELADRNYGPFPHDVRRTVHRFLIDEIRKHSSTTPVSLCLENGEMWREFGEELGLMNDGFLCNCGPFCTPGATLYEDRQRFFAATNRGK